MLEDALPDDLALCARCGRVRKKFYMRAAPGVWLCIARSSCKMNRLNRRNQKLKHERLQREAAQDGQVD